MTIRKLFLFAAFSGSVVCAAQSSIVLKSGALAFTFQKQGFRYSFAIAGKSVVTADATAGLLLEGSPFLVYRHIKHPALSLKIFYQLFTALLQ